MGKAAAKVQLVCPVSGRCANLGFFTGGSCLVAPQRKPPERGRCRRASRHYPLLALSAIGAKLWHHERAGCSSRAVTAAFPLRLCSYACSRTGATETIMVAIKKKKKKKNSYSSAGRETHEFGSDTAFSPPSGAGSNIYTFLTCELFNQGKAIPEQALF